MPKYIVEGSDLTSVANAIRTAGGTSGSLSFPNGWNSAINAIGGGGGGLEYEEGTWTPSTDVADAWISFTNTHTVAPFAFLISDVIAAYSDVNYSIYTVYYENHHQLFGVAQNNDNSGGYTYGLTQYRYRSNSTGMTHGTRNLTSSYTDTADTTYTNSRYWAKETGIHASDGSSSHYFRANRTYKWIAVWAPTT